MPTVPEHTSASRRDLAVAYRVYPGLSRTPLFGLKDKLELATLCLRSFREGLGQLRVKLWALLDNCPPSYEQLFREMFAAQDLEIVSLPGLGNEATFLRQIDLLTEQTQADLVYFAEDDYLYLPGAFEKMVNLIRHQPGVDFVTAYDHADYYSLALHNRSCRLTAAADHHWRSSASTCLSFLTSRKVLQSTRDVFASYTRGNADAGLWMSLTKTQLFNPMTIGRSLRERPFVVAAMALAWRHCWSQVLFGRRHQLWSPVPALATHMESTGVAPVIDWARVWRQLGAGSQARKVESHPESNPASIPSP